MLGPSHRRQAFAFHGPEPDRIRAVRFAAQEVSTVGFGAEVGPMSPLPPLPPAPATHPRFAQGSWDSNACKLRRFSDGSNSSGATTASSHSCAPAYSTSEFDSLNSALSDSDASETDEDILLNLLDDGFDEHHPHFASASWAAPAPVTGPWSPTLQAARAPAAAPPLLTDPCPAEPAAFLNAFETGVPPALAFSAPPVPPPQPQMQMQMQVQQQPPFAPESPVIVKSEHVPVTTTPRVGVLKVEPSAPTTAPSRKRNRRAFEAVHTHAPAAASRPSKTSSSTKAAKRAVQSAKATAGGAAAPAAATAPSSKRRKSFDAEEPRLGPNGKRVVGNRELTSRFRGVCWYKRTNKWVVQIKIDGKRKHIGYYTSEEEAGTAYDNALRDLVLAQRARARELGPRSATMRKPRRRHFNKKPADL